MASRPGLTRAAASPKYVRAASAVAMQELVNVSGSCGRTRTVNAVQKVAVLREGSSIEDGPREVPDEACTSITATPIPTSASEIGYRRVRRAAARTAAPRGTARRGVSACWAKLFGGSETRFQEI